MRELCGGGRLLSGSRGIGPRREGGVREVPGQGRVPRLRPAAEGRARRVGRTQRTRAPYPSTRPSTASDFLGPQPAPPAAKNGPIREQQRGGHERERRRRARDEECDHRARECDRERDESALRTTALGEQGPFVAMRGAQLTPASASRRRERKTSVGVVDLAVEGRLPVPIPSGEGADAVRLAMARSVPPVTLHRAQL
jgi:hypothetical protein